MSRRYLIPTNLFYRENDPLPPDFPQPNQGDIYFNTVSRTLRLWQDDGGGFAWRDLQVRIDTGDPENPVPPIYDITSADASIIVSNPGTGIADITVDASAHYHDVERRGRWTYATQTTMADPGSGRIRSDASPATQIAISSTTNEGADASVVLAGLTTGDVLTFQEFANASNWARYEITSPALNTGSWFLFPVELIDNDTDGIDVPKNADIVVSIGGGGGGGTKVHGELEQLDQDDHPQYLTSARGDALYDPINSASVQVTAHEADANPHAQYLTAAEGDAAYVNLSGDIMTGALTATDWLIKAAGVTNEAHFVAGEGDPNTVQPLIVGAGVYVNVLNGGIWTTPFPGDNTVWELVGSSGTHDHPGLYADASHNHGTVYAPIEHLPLGDGGTAAGTLLHVQYSGSAPADLALAAYTGVSDAVSRADHVHKRPTLGELSAAPSSHTHDGSDIDSGTVAFLRLPTGTTGTTVAVGDHTHAYVPVTRTLTAGAGLTGGGALSQDRAFDIGAGTGITVNADSIAVNKTTLDGWYDGSGTAQSLVSDHEGLADPHAQYQLESEKGVANGYPPLDGSGVIPESYIPAVPPNELFSVANATERTTYATYTGNGWSLNYRDEVIQEDDGTLWVYVGPDPATSDSDLVSGNWTQKSSGGVVSVNGETGAVTGFVKDSRSIIAGSGLTGGGNLSANRTLAVGQGEGISVTATTVAIDRAIVNEWYENAGDIATAIAAHHDAGSSDHDDRYYTESETNVLLAGKSDDTHLHDARYVEILGDTMTGELRITDDFSAFGTVRTDDPANFETKIGFLWIREDDDTGAGLGTDLSSGSYSGTDHTHANYSPSNHTHLGEFASTGHSHAYADLAHSHNYLPLSGGVVTGNLQIDGLLAVPTLSRPDDPPEGTPGLLWVNESDTSQGSSLGDPANHYHDDRYVQLGASGGNVGVLLRGQSGPSTSGLWTELVATGGAWQVFPSDANSLEPWWTWVAPYPGRAVLYSALTLGYMSGNINGWLRLNAQFTGTHYAADPSPQRVYWNNVDAPGAKTDMSFASSLPLWLDTGASITPVWEWNTSYTTQPKYKMHYFNLMFFADNGDTPLLATISRTGGVVPN
jgi:hypothetical protein